MLKHTLAFKVRTVATGDDDPSVRVQSKNSLNCFLPSHASPDC